MVIEEIKATPKERLRNLLSEVIKNFQILPITSKAEELTKEYLSFLRIPEGDALHVAYSNGRRNRLFCYVE